MSSAGRARRLRREQTDEEKQLWKALRAGRFAGFKWRRQHPAGDYHLDFYCPLARLAVELDGFAHGLPRQAAHDRARDEYLQDRGIEVLRFWNHQWRGNREGILISIWRMLHERTGCTTVIRKSENHRFIAPNPSQLFFPDEPTTTRRHRRNDT